MPKVNGCAIVSRACEYVEPSVTPAEIEYASLYEAQANYCVRYANEPQRNIFYRTEPEHCQAGWEWTAFAPEGKTNRALVIPGYSKPQPNASMYCITHGNINSKKRSLFYKAINNKCDPVASFGTALTQPSTGNSEPVYFYDKAMPNTRKYCYKISNSSTHGLRSLVFQQHPGYGVSSCNSITEWNGSGDVKLGAGGEFWAPYEEIFDGKKFTIVSQHAKDKMLTVGIIHPEDPARGNRAVIETNAYDEKQKFTLELTSDGYSYRIFWAGTNNGKYLTADSPPKGNWCFWANSRDNNPSQQWYILPNYDSDGSYRIRHKQSNFFLDVVAHHSTTFVVVPLSGTGLSNQNWILEEMS
jgi:hypothetical protein